MKYYIKDNKIQAYYTEGATEYSSPIHPDGVTILPKHSALEYDDEGNITNPDVVAILTKQAEEKAHADWKADRQALVDAIIVTTTAGNAFDGDEISQGRLSRATSVMDDVETTTWVLADDTVVQATKAELLEALKLAGQAQTAVWVR